MKPLPWVNFSANLSGVSTLYDSLRSDDFMLFRGQPGDHLLLPKIARDNPKLDSTHLERDMLTRLRRQGDRFPEIRGAVDLDLLAIAQHHGMSTRLLDWSSNPLVGFWFACSEPSTAQPAHLYMYRAGRDVVLDPAVDADPFSFPTTKFFQPPFNSARVAAQGGWFSVHPYYAQDKFKALDEDVIHTPWIWHMEIPASEKPSVLKKLNALGVNHRSLFPDLDGLCRHISWEHTSQWPLSAF